MSDGLQTFVTIKETNAPVIGATVKVYADSHLLARPLGSYEKTGNTPFTINFPQVYSSAHVDTKLTVVVTNSVGREIYRKTDLDDNLGPGNKLNFDIAIPQLDFSGFLVTLLTGDTSPDQNSPGGWGVCQGTTVKFLMDHDAFAESAQLFQQARDSIYLSQLYFPLPKVFNQDAASEDTSLIFAFDNPPLDAENLRKEDALDLRPERLLIDAADRDVDVKVLLHAVQLPLFFKILAGVLLFPFVGTDCISLVKELLDADFTDADEVQSYFQQSGRKKLDAQPFLQPIIHTGVMHAKIMVADSARVVSIGSPYKQGYNDSHDHLIDAPMRGNEDEFPKHDAGFSAMGPVIQKFHETLELLWNNRSDNPDSSDAFPTWPPAVPDSHHGAGVPPLEGDAVCTAQVVRTLSAGRFKNPADGEKGILEAYLRAIDSAQDFIYLETQYFTDDNIGTALAQAMNRNSNKQLQTILVLNIRPDMPLYPFKQRRLIQRIREAIGYTNRDAPPLRFGVFTRWTHRPTTQGADQRPQILPIYIHAKAGLVDNSWATVGSANLDGLSLDSCLVGDYLNRIFEYLPGTPQLREQRAIELNLCMLNNVDGAPQSDAVDILRRKLWAEHLGYSSAPGTPDIDAEDLKTRPADGWLQLWHDRARASLQQLIDSPTQPLTGMAQVLPWPDQNTTYKTPRAHIEALGIKSYKVVPLKSTRAFDFKAGDWKSGSQAEMDF